MILVGSTALNIHAEWLRVPFRQPRDVDVACTCDEFMGLQEANSLTIVKYFWSGRRVHTTAPDGRRWDFELALEGSTCRELIQLVEQDNDSIRLFVQSVNALVVLPSIDVLFTIKACHLFLTDSREYEKTKADCDFLRSIGATIPLRYESWSARRKQEEYWHFYNRLQASTPH